MHVIVTPIHIYIDSISKFMLLIDFVVHIVITVT